MGTLRGINGFRRLAREFSIGEMAFALPPLAV